MTLADILEQLRKLYVDEFARRVEGYPPDMRALLRPEAIYRIDSASVDGVVEDVIGDDNVVRTGALNLPARGDVCVVRDQRIVEIARIESPRRLNFEAFRFVWGDALEVALHPFSWDDCALCIPEPKIAVDDQPLAAWLEAALLIDKLQADGDQPLGAVHGMTVPRQAEDGVRFEVDLGSAPVAQFEALLSALVSAGAGMVIIGHP